ncbi:MAG: NACHT domain-containing protein, partial [Gammaproteobacteria bacterium]
KSEGYSLQEESFRVFAEQQYLRKNRDTREIFASYREGYQDILSDAFDDGEERKGEPALPKVFFSYAWPILNEFPHEWWNQLFLVGLCQDLREFFGVEAYIDVIDSVDDAKKYMADNFSYNASEADSHDSKNLICIVGSQSYVEKCENDAFSTSMVRDEERYIHEIIDQYSNREYSLPSQQRPLMAFSLGIYQSCILSSFHGKILAHESHRYSYYQLLQAVLYKLVLFMPDGDEQKYRCRDFLASMRQNSLLEHLFKRTEDAIQDYYWSKAYREDIDDLRNTFNLQHWLEGELEDVLSAWDEGILEERKQTIEERPHYKAADAFLALLDPTMLTDEDVLVAKEVLKDRYLEESTIALFEDERPIPLEKLFVNLIIVKEDEQRKKDLGMKEAKREDFQVLTQHYDDIHTPKEEIDVKNIFKGSNNLSEQETPRTIELLGRAGIGKTTFLLYLLRQWALGEPWLEGYQAMFYFPLKKVVHKYDKGGAYSMAEVLRKEFFLGVPDFTLEKANAYWRY